MSGDDYFYIFLAWNAVPCCVLLMLSIIRSSYRDRRIRFPCARTRPVAVLDVLSVRHDS